jgi:hypothetical protein
MSQWEILKQECPRLFKNEIVFECALGWYKILHDLSTKIEIILEKNAEKYKICEGKENEYCEMYAIQIKEKYGTLRFYMSCETDEISDLISETEALSSQTCESCGAMAKMRGTRWFEVKCDNCFKERE